MRTRYRRNKRRRIGEWPAGVPSPDEVAGEVQYTGSPEHKSHPSSAGPAGLRSDATPCDPQMSRDIDRNTEALREGIRRQCVSDTFQGKFPKYVWSWIDGRLYEARHINGPQGEYKGYRLEPPEYPHDPQGKLNWEQK